MVVIQPLEALRLSAINDVHLINNAKKSMHALNLNIIEIHIIRPYKHIYGPWLKNLS